MTPTEEQTAEERAKNRALTLWRLRGSGDEFPIYLQLCCEIEELRLTNQRLEAEVERMKRGFDCDFRDLLWWYSNTAENPIGMTIGEILPQFFKERLRELSSREQKGES